MGRTRVVVLTLGAVAAIGLIGLAVVPQTPLAGPPLAATPAVAGPAAGPPDTSVGPPAVTRWADRRPVGWIPTHGAARTPQNPDGWNRHLLDPDEGYRWLFEQLTTRPWTRYVIHQPAGWPGDDVKAMGGSHYWTLDPARRDMYTRAIHDAMTARPEITVGIYGGINYKWTHSPEMAGFHVAQFADGRDRWAMWNQTIAPWIRAGAYEYWFDNAARPEKLPSGLDFCEWLMAVQFVHAGVEAIPMNPGPPGPGRAVMLLDTDALDRAPAVANLRYLQRHDRDRRWDVRERNYEAIALVYRTEGDVEPPLDLLTSLLERGFVLGATEQYDELVQRAYRAVRPAALASEPP